MQEGDKTSFFFKLDSSLISLLYVLYIEPYTYSKNIKSENVTIGIAKKIDFKVGSGAM